MGVTCSMGKTIIPKIQVFCVMHLSRLVNYFQRLGGA
jgi:hypothetical protein